MTTIIGLTGSLGTGKTTVAKLFEKCGAVIIDADQITHQAIHRGGSCFTRVLKAFGKTILKGDDVDRKKLAEIVFKDPKQLLKLERIVHPAVLKQIRNEIRFYKKNKSENVVVIDVPLLFESGLYRDVNLTIVVKTSQQKQIERAMQRLKCTQSEAMRRIKMQMPLSQKVRLADITIDNNGTIRETEKQVKIIWQKI